MLSTHKKLWIVSVVLCIPFGVLLHLNKESELHPILSFLFFTFSAILAGTVAGAFIGLIPFRKKTYSQKFTITHPLCISLVLSVFIFLFSWGYARDVKNYDRIKISPDLDCSTLHNAKYESEVAIFEMHEHYLVQINKKTNDTITLGVEWKSDCEYYLLNPDSTIISKVKITKVTKDEFECYSTLSNTRTKKFKYRRIKD